MIYTKEFEKSLMFYFTPSFVDNIALEIMNENHNRVRILLEDSLDDPLVMQKGKIRDANLYKGRKQAYSLFMNEYIKDLDANNNRRR